MATDAVKGAYNFINGEKKKEGSSIQPKEFFWDQFLKYIASAILALTVLNVTVEFLRGGGVSCFPPSDNVVITAQDLEGRMLYEFGRGQTSYINNYCARSVPSTEYFPIYILVHGLLLIVPHYIWNALHNGDFDSFFSIVDKLDRLRDKSGDYSTKNFDLVTKLELEYSGRRIYYTYILKLLLQLAVCIGSISFSALYFLDCDFSFSFCCPDDNGCSASEEANVTCPVNITGRIPQGWPLIINVPCVFVNLRVLNLVRYADFVLLGVAILLVLFSLVWCFVRHTEQLGHEAIAKFSFHSCLNADLHSFPSPIFWPVYKCFKMSVDKLETLEDKQARQKQIKRFWPFTHYPQPHLLNLFSPRILNDLDFLLLMLFRADSSHGQVFKDIQISKDLKVFTGRDHQLLHLFINIQHDRNDNPRRKDTEIPAQGANVGATAQPTETSNPEQNDNDSVVLVEEAGTGIQVEDDIHLMFLDPKIDVDHSIDDPEKTVFENFKDYLGNLVYDKDLFSGMRDWIYYFARTFGPKRDSPQESLLRNVLALDISFGSVGFARVLARPFKKVVSLDFHPFFCDFTEEALNHFYTNYKSARVPHDVFTQDKETINLVGSILEEAINPKRYLTDFIVIGPLDEEPKRTVVNLLLNLLFTAGYIRTNAVLLAIRPLKVGSKKVTSHFHSYEPPKILFKEQTIDDKLKDHQKRKKQMRKVDNCNGVKIVLGEIPCVFEFKIYKFTRTQELQQTNKNNDNSLATTNSVLNMILSLPPPPTQPRPKKNETAV